MKCLGRAALIGAGLCSALSVSAQTVRQLVLEALIVRDSVHASERMLEAAKHLSSASGVWGPTRLEAGSGTRPDVTGGEDLTLFQPIDLFGKARASKSGGRAEVRAAEAELRQAKLTVQTEVLQAFSNWANAVRTLGFAHEQLDIAAKVEATTRERVDARSLPAIQLLRASLEVQRAQQLVIDREASVVSAANMLDQAVGSPARVGPAQANEGLGRGMMSAPKPESERPELLALAAQRDAALAESRQSRLSLLPDVELQARRTPWSTTESYGLRLQFVIPLYDHGAAREKTSAASLRAQAALLAYDDTRKRVAAEVRSAVIGVDAAERSLKAYESMANVARELVMKSQRGFEAGAGTLIDVLDARRALADALEQFSNARLALDLAVSELLRANGEILGER